MKIHKASLIALLAAGGLLACGTTMRAQEEKKPATPPESKPAEQRPADRPGRGQGGGFSVDERLARLTEQLTLTDEQKPKVKVLLEEQNKQFEQARDLPQEDRRAKMRSFREEMNTKMKAILTEEQFKKYEELRPGRGQGQGQGQGGNRPERPAAPEGEKKAE